ncbi:Origin recognition complex subunit 2 [Castilleja foliolosa]|uniref:Origin recognition complex subunit 2 n=1 Tax=Castilleja foliolosa TaxID=1961234 RepID=A0ABD3B6U9_9LAMI
MSQGSFESPRRAVRKRTKPQKYGDFVELSPTKRKIDVDSDSSEEEFAEDQCHQKPTDVVTCSSWKIDSRYKKPNEEALFGNDDVEGQDIFKFKSRHTKLDLQNKVKAAISSSPSVAESPLKTPGKASTGDPLPVQ